MGRRGENIRKRKDGRWEARYSMKEKGVSKSYSVYGKTYGEVKEKLLTAKTERYGKTEEGREKEHILEKQEFSEEEKDVLFGDIFCQWIKWVEENRKPSTCDKYRSVYDKHMEKRFGRKKMTEVGKWFAEGKAFDGLELFSESLKRSMCSIVYQTGQYAFEKYGIPKACRAKMPKNGVKRPVETFNQWEMMRLLGYLHEKMDMSRMGIVLALFTGLRLGELCALRWEDVDIELRVIRVRRTVQRIRVGRRRTQLWIGEPKSICSRREIPLSDDMWKLLGRFYQREGYVFGENDPMDPRTYQNQYRRYLKEAGVGYKNFHTCRHTFATNCVRSGADVKSLCEILGHSSVRITLDRYVHPALETKRSHMNRLFSIYGQRMGQAI